MANGSSRMIACSYVFIEKCSVGAMKCVLLSMRVAYMIDLQIYK